MEWTSEYTINFIPLSYHEAAITLPAEILNDRLSMGASYSEPVPSPNEEIGYTSIVFRTHDKVRLVNATPTVVNAVAKVIR